MYLFNLVFNTIFLEPLEDNRFKWMLLF